MDPGGWIARNAGWFWLGGALVLIVAIKTISPTTGTTSDPLAVGSSRPDGAMALNLWLNRIGYQTRVVDSPGFDWSSEPTSTTAFAVAPKAGFSAGQSDALLRWVRGGGTLVLGTDGATTRLLTRLDISVVPAPPDAVEVSQPLLRAPAATRLWGDALAVASRTGSAVPVAQSADGPVLIRLRLGRGLVWILTAPHLLDNRHLPHADNRRLALNLAGPRRTTVLFDEAPFASAGPVTDWLTETEWGVAFLFLLAVFLLYRWLGGWRLGPPVVPPTAGWRPSVEFVISMAGVLKRAQKRSDVLRTYQRELERVMVERHGVPRPDPAGFDRKRIDELLAPSDPPSDRALTAAATAIVECEDDVRRARV